MYFWVTTWIFRMYEALQSLPRKYGYLYFAYVFTRFHFVLWAFSLLMGKVAAKQQLSFIALSTPSLREVLMTTKMVDYVRCKYKVVELPFKMSMLYLNQHPNESWLSKQFFFFFWSTVYFNYAAKYVSRTLSCVLGALRVGLWLHKRSFSSF